MKKTCLFYLLAVLAGSLPVMSASAQIQWTPQQQEVWKTETMLGDLLMKNDPAALKEASNYIDNSYISWPLNSRIPIPKAIKAKEIKYKIAEGGKTDLYVAVPAAIWVNGDYAYADYYFSTIYEDKAGKKTQVGGRWMDVLMKKNGKWMIVGDFGGVDMPPKSK